MAATTKQERASTEFADLGGSGSSDIVSRAEWVTVRRFRSSPPDTDGDWWINCGYSMIVPPTATGEIRLLATDIAQGSTWVVKPEEVIAPGKIGGVTQYVKVLDGAEATREYSIDVQARVTIGSAGYLRVTEVKPMWWSTPPVSMQQPSVQAGFAGGSQEAGGVPQTLVNPAPGTGNTMIAMVVAPGPGYDDPGDAWVEPPNATPVVDYQVDPSSVHQFVQRFRVWTFVEEGSPTYTFGYNKPAGENWQQAAIFGLDRVVPFVRGFGPVVNTDDNTGYPTVDVVDDYLVIAVSTTQQSHELLTQPVGYTPIFNGTQTPGGGSLTDWRRMAQAYKAVSNATETPGGALWSANAGEAHAHFTLIVPPGGA